MTANNPETPFESSQTKNDNNENIENSSNPSPETSPSTTEIPTFGWSKYAERVNGRFAMIGFAAILLIEAISHSSFLHWAGLIP